MYVCPRCRRRSALWCFVVSPPLLNHSPLSESLSVTRVPVKGMVLPLSMPLPEIMSLSPSPFSSRMAVRSCLWTKPFRRHRVLCPATLHAGIGSTRTPSMPLSSHAVSAMADISPHMLLKMIFVVMILCGKCRMACLSWAKIGKIAVAASHVHKDLNGKEN